MMLDWRMVQMLAERGCGADVCCWEWKTVVLMWGDGYIRIVNPFLHRFN